MRLEEEPDSGDIIIIIIFITIPDTNRVRALSLQGRYKNRASICRGAIRTLYRGHIYRGPIYIYIYIELCMYRGHIQKPYIWGLMYRGLYIECLTYRGAIYRGPIYRDTIYRRPIYRSLNRAPI